jgi:ABC-type oligopeptide transport system substrate-binding subunit
MFAKRALFIALIVSACLTATACGDRSSSGRAATDQNEQRVLRRGNGGDPETLDPARAEDEHAFNILADIYEGLLIDGGDGTLQPGVAERWSISNDGTTYTFELREDARWSNHEPVIAEHFIIAFRRVLTPETVSAYSFLLLPLQNAQAILDGRLPAESLGVEAVDDHTLVIHLEAPTPSMLAVLAMPIALPVWPESLLDPHAFRDPDKFVGNGPFVLDEWSPIDRISVRRNPAFHDAASIGLDRVDYFPIEDPMTEMNRYRAGELDITATVPPEHIKALQESHLDELRITPRLAVYYIAFDLSEPPFDAVALRQALSMAVDREVLVAAIGRGERPAYGFVPDGVSSYKSARYGWQSLSAGERHAEARRLLALASWGSASLKLIYDVGDIHEKIAIAVSSMWRDVLGIEVMLEKREWQYFLATREQRQEWQMMRFAWTGDYNHPSTFTDLLTTNNPQNLPAYSNSHYDELLSRAAVTLDNSEQLQLYARAELMMLRDYPLIPLYFYVSKHLVAPTVLGFQSNPLDRHPSRFLRLRD